MNFLSERYIQKSVWDTVWHAQHHELSSVSYLDVVCRLRHYQRQFAAHLDGMLAADDSIAEFAAAELKRWKSDGELFAVAYLALARPDVADGQLFAVARGFLQAHPQPHFVEAVAHVFPWLEAGSVQEVFGAWSVSDDPLLQRIALAALGLRREAYPLDIPPLTTLFTHSDPALRAEACRYAGRLRRFDCLAHVRLALTDPDADVREQAAIALLVCNEPAAALPELFAAVMRYSALVDHGGIASIRAERRAQHLARLLGHAIPYPCSPEAAASLLAELPPYLAILTLAYHGNPALIPLLLPFLRDGEKHKDQARPASTGVNAPSAPPAALHASGLYKRRALWAISFILGINPEHEGLLADDPSLSADWPIAPGLDQDTGLPEGDADKVERWWQMHYAQYIQLSTVQLPALPSPAPQSPAPAPQSLALAPLLSGKRMDSPAAAKELLASGMQAQRFAAALHACRLSRTAPWVDTRAPWAMQKRWMSQIPE